MAFLRAKTISVRFGIVFIALVHKDYHTSSNIFYINQNGLLFSYEVKQPSFVRASIGQTSSKTDRVTVVSQLQYTCHFGYSD